MIVVLGFNFLGDGLRDILDPRLGRTSEGPKTPSETGVLDVLIRGGWVADGTGSPPFLGDVAIEDGRIAEVGRLAGSATAALVIDASGKIVCPGFVDPHSHSDFSLLANPTAESTIRQGVTTEVVGNCGWSYAPVTDSSREYMSSRLTRSATTGR